MLSAAKHLCADRDRPFAEFTLSVTNVLRVTIGEMPHDSKGHHCHAEHNPCHSEHNFVILNEVKNLVAPSRSETTLHHNDREGMIMLINKMTQPSVGADLSRTPPIYRPSMDSRMSTLNSQYAQSRTSNLPVPSSSFISPGSLNNVSYF